MKSYHVAICKHKTQQIGSLNTSFISLYQSTVIYVKGYVSLAPIILATALLAWHVSFIRLS